MLWVNCHASIQQDYIETQMLLSSENVNQEALLCYAREAADFGTNYQLPTLDFAMNHCGQPDVAMFDFTSMHASENAALIRERFGHQLVVSLVGDSLLEVRKWKVYQVKSSELGSGECRMLRDLAAWEKPKVAFMAGRLSLLRPDAAGWRVCESGIVDVLASVGCKLLLLFSVYRLILDDDPLGS